MTEEELTAITERLGKWAGDEPGNRLTDDHDKLLAEVARLRTDITQARAWASYHCQGYAWPSTERPKTVGQAASDGWDGFHAK